MEDTKKDAETKAKSPLHGKTVLWVEDDKFLSDILSKKFVQVGCDIQHAKDGAEAFKLLEKITPDVILLDIFLPGMNGFDILQKVKMNPKLRPIPVIILSNTSQQGDLEKAKVLGANLFLVKAAASLDHILHEVGLLVK